MTMRILFVAALVAMAGCATSGPTLEQFNALEARVDRLESALQDAQSDASGAARSATAAERTAQRALDAANQANERIERLGETCCNRK